MATLVSGLSGIRNPGSSIPLYGDSMMWLKSFNYVDHYYSYSGSLPHPPCNELVTWIVMENPGTIGIKQVTKQSLWHLFIYVQSQQIQLDKFKLRE